MNENKLLLVDDEEGLRKVLNIALSDSGYQVLLAENGREALDIFLKERPPIVMTDIKMPGMDGLELLRRIKVEFPETEVIMLTGHGDMDLAIKSLEYEATYFITKPIEDGDLDAALNRAKRRIESRKAQQAYADRLSELIGEVDRLESRADFSDTMPQHLNRELARMAAKLKICLLALDQEAPGGNPKHLSRVRDAILEIADRLSDLTAKKPDVGR
jgi:YesN/AraC family two-component response regulator